jgi:hypothetical protein
MIKNEKQWVSFNYLTQTYDTLDETKVSAELIDSAECLADVLNISSIRDNQRADKISKK